VPDERDGGAADVTMNVTAAGARPESVTVAGAATARRSGGRGE